MPPTRPSRKEPAPSVRSPKNDIFNFPSDHHLVITTEQHVLSFDHRGLHKIFKSGSSGILASKEAVDGSGTLAIADSQVVVLHQVEKGMEKSYRLKGTEGQIRLLAFAPDSKSLYFSTTVLNAVQSYSIKAARLLEPSPTHNSAPTVLAVSPTSHLLLTASESPPTVYLQSLTSSVQPLFVQPLASRTPAVSASFHPEQPDLFLLAFKDGTLAFYDATEIIQSGHKATRNTHAEGCEFSYFKSLHTVTSSGYVERIDNGAIGSRSLGVTGAAFLPGYKTRAISVGADGKCNILDFETTRILRTWHVNSSATSLSVLNTGFKRKPTSKGITKSLKIESAVPTLVIAIGTMDGKTRFYDNSGALLLEKAVDSDGGRVIDVEWIKGATPKTFGESPTLRFANETCIELFECEGTLRSHTSTVRRSGSPKKLSRQSSRKTNQSTIGRDGSPQSSASIYSQDGADDVYDTVKHHDIAGPVHRDLPAVSTNDYMDLFSPVKRRTKCASPPQQSPRRRSTPRPRPRLSSSTFVDQGSPSKAPRSNPVTVKQDGEEHMMSGALNPPRSQSKTQARLDHRKKNSNSPIEFKKASRYQLQIDNSPTIGKLRIPGAFQNTYSTSTLDTTTSTTSSANSKILADIRRFCETGSSGGKSKSSNLALLAPYMPTQSSKTHKRRRSSTVRSQLIRSRNSVQSPAKDVPDYSKHVRVKTVRKTDADDIWLTADSDFDENPSRGPRSSRRRSKPAAKVLGPIVPGEDTRNETELKSKRTIQGNSTHRDSFAQIPTAEPLSTQRRKTVRLQLASPRISPTRMRPRTTFYPPALIPHIVNPSPSPTRSEAGSLYSEALETLSSGVMEEENSHETSPKRTEHPDNTLLPTGTTHERFVSAPELPLPPGYAQSYQGPVDVGSYLPRKGSLAFVEPAVIASPRKVRNVLGDTTGNEGRDALDTPGRKARHRHHSPSQRDEANCESCEELRDEVQKLRQEIAQLRRLVKRRGISVDDD